MQRYSAERTISGSAGSHLTREEHERIAGEIQQSSETEESFDEQLNCSWKRRSSSRCAARSRGKSSLGKSRRSCFKRPVEKGQLLLTVANAEGEWELDVMMPEDRMGFVARGRRTRSSKRRNAQKKRPEETTAANVDSRLDASYILATNPGARHHGKVIEIVPSAHVQGEEGNVVLVKVSLDKSRSRRRRSAAKGHGDGENRLRHGLDRLLLVPRFDCVRARRSGSVCRYGYGSVSPDGTCGSSFVEDGTRSQARQAGLYQGIHPCVSD